MKTFVIIKKNRKYFAAETGGYKCKILIDENSKDLEEGKHELEVDDISIRTNYGTDLIFKLSGSVTEQKEAGICTLQHGMYNKKLLEECRKLNGKWDKSSEAWVFSGLVEDQVEALDEKYNSELVAVELTFNDYTSAHTDSVDFCGIPLAKAWGRDSGAKLGEWVSLISGKIYSGGSMKNWRTCIEEGTIMRLYVPEALLDEIDLECSVKRI